MPGSVWFGLVHSHKNCQIHAAAAMCSNECAGISCYSLFGIQPFAYKIFTFGRTKNIIIYLNGECACRQPKFICCLFPVSHRRQFWSCVFFLLQKSRRNEWNGAGMCAMHVGDTNAKKWVPNEEFAGWLVRIFFLSRPTNQPDVSHIFRMCFSVCMPN